MRKSLRLALAVAAVWVPLAFADPATDQFNFAEGLFIQQDYVSAIEEYRALLKQHPQAPQAVTAAFRVGEACFRQQDAKAAAQAYQEALAKHPQAPEAPLAQYNLGRSLLKLGDAATALPAFEAAAKATDAALREEARVGAGECLLLLNRRADAAELYRQFLADFPKSRHRPDILFSRGWALAQEAHHQDAVEPFTTLLKEFPDYAARDKARLALSDAYTELGRFDEAAKLLQEMIDHKQDAEAALLRLAWTHFKRGDKAQAAKTFLAFADQYPKSEQVASALFNAGIAAYDQQAYADAVTTFQRLRQARPDAPESRDLRLWLGIALYHAGQHQAAVDELAVVLKDKLGTPEQLGTASYTRAEALAALAQHAPAAEAFAQVVADFPQSRYVDNARYARAIAQQNAGDLEAAVATLRELLEKSPQSALRGHALFALSEYLYRLKQPAEALPYLLELAKQPGDDQARVLYRLGWAQFDAAQYAEALATFRQLAPLPGEFQAEALYMAGRAAESLSQPADATTLYEQLAQRPGDDAFVDKGLYRLAFLLEGDAAAKNLERYRQRFPQGEHYAAMRLRHAEQRFKAGDTAAALAIYQEATAQPLTPELGAAAWYGLGWCLLKGDKLAEADAAFAKVAAGKPEPEVARDAILQRAELAYRQDRFADAAKLFDQLKEVAGPQGERALYMLGWCALRSDDNAAATTAFRRLLERYPEGEYRLDTAIRLATLYKNEGKFEDARTLLAGCLEKAEGELEEQLLHLYCDVLVALKDWDTLIKSSDRLRQRFPESPRHYLLTFRLGLAYKELGIYDKAEAAFRETIAKTETIEAAKAQFNLGAIYYSKKEYLEAGKQFLRVDMLYDYPELSPKALYHAIDAFVQAEGKESPRIEVHLKKLREKHADSPWTRQAGELLASSKVAAP